MQPSCVSSTVIWRRGQMLSQCLRLSMVLKVNACRMSSGSAKSYTWPARPGTSVHDIQFSHSGTAGSG